MKASLIIGVILIVIGVFYALLPHSVHLSSGLDLGLSHGIHILIGLILLVIGIILIIVNRRKK